MTNSMLDVGEKNFLEGLLSKLDVDERFVNGFGHDASIIDLGFSEANIVMKTDRAAQPIASLKGWSDYRTWGRIAVTANCSDILAVGGTPKAFMIAVCVPASFKAQKVEEIVIGAQEECNRLGVAFLGGDTKESSAAEVIGSAIGTIPKNLNFKRHSASEGDLILQLGSVGGFVGAHWLLTESSETIPGQSEALEYVSHPQCKNVEAKYVRERYSITSGTDLSDGLFEGLRNIPQSDCGAKIYPSKILYHSLVKEMSGTLNTDIFKYAFGVGDWALLYCVSGEHRDELLADTFDGLDINLIGEITGCNGVVAEVDGQDFNVKSVTNEHFRQRMEDDGGYFKSLETQFSLIKV